MIFEMRLQKAVRALAEAEYVVIGGGAGLSDAAGIRYSGKRFTDHFAAFIEKYGLKDMYASAFYPFKTPEERWAYWAKHISLNRYGEAALPLYTSLHRLVEGKKHFVLTTNVDGQFRKAGFSGERIFAVQGDYAYFQCAHACHDTLYPNEAHIAEMARQVKDCAIPSALVPRCPRCGGEMEVHVHKDDFFVLTDQWHRARRRYRAFLRACAGKRGVLLELGVGFNTPGIIRFPFERMAAADPDMTLIRCNRDHPAGSEENAARTLTFTEDMAEVIAAFRQGLGKGEACPREGAVSCRGLNVERNTEDF